MIYIWKAGKFESQQSELKRHSCLKAWKPSFSRVLITWFSHTTTVSRADNIWLNVFRFPAHWANILICARPRDHLLPNDNRICSKGNCETAVCIWQWPEWDFKWLSSTNIISWCFDVVINGTKNYFCRVYEFKILKKTNFIMVASH